jgi:hypothetical protein
MLQRQPWWKRRLSRFRQALTRPAVVPIAVAFLAIALWTVVGSLLVPGAQRTDFLNLYTGASLALHGNFRHLYDYQVQSEVSRSLMPDVTAVFPFVRPPFYALAISPIALLPFRDAFAAWLVLQTLVLLAVWYWAWRTFGPDSLVWTSLFLPTTLGIASGQDCVVMLGIFCGVWEAFRRKLDTVAGVLLALTLFKFHLFLLIPIALVAARKWRVLATYSAGGLALATLSLFLSGWQGARSYAALLLRQDLATLAPSPERMLGLNGLLANLGVNSRLATLLLAVIVVLLVARCAWLSRENWHWFWSAVAGSMLVSPHTYAYDGAVLLIPGLLAIFRGETTVLRATGAVILVPLLYGFNLAGPPYAAVLGLALVTFFAALSLAVPQKVDETEKPLPYSEPNTALAP